MNKKKNFNDPVYGFITIPYDIIFDLIEHPYFQRLRRIRQLGLTHLVYPGALHTRLHHALGSLHLMIQAVDTLRSKGHEITEEESKAACIAILLHDIGHAPFSHALENTLVKNISHEDISLIFMEELNRQFNGALDTAIGIFRNAYPKHFLHNLVSSQLDMDRLDYLNRDSFYTGVLEGKIGAQRIIKMLNIADDQLVVEEKGIYSLEKFIVARRLMYWQVYLHKTVLSAEQLLVKILQRAKFLAENGDQLFASPTLSFFLNNKINGNDLRDKTILEKYAQLDDYDIYGAIKVWAEHKDFVLSKLCSNLVNRRLYKIKIQKEAFDVSELNAMNEQAAVLFEISKKEAEYFTFIGDISNSAYNPIDEQIKILYKNGQLKELSEESDQMDLAVLSRPVQKHFWCFANELTEESANC